MRAFPAALGRLRALRTLYAYNNSIETVPPPTFAGLEALEELDLSDNLLCGDSPLGNALVPLKSLRLIRIANNSLNALPLLPPNCVNKNKNNNNNNVCLLAYIRQQK